MIYYLHPYLTLGQDLRESETSFVIISIYFKNHVPLLQNTNELDHHNLLLIKHFLESSMFQVTSSSTSLHSQKYQSLFT